MPAKSQKQRKLFAMVYAYKKGELDPKYASDTVKKIAKSISLKDAKKFASSVKQCQENEDYIQELLQQADEQQEDTEKRERILQDIAKVEQRLRRELRRNRYRY